MYETFYTIIQTIFFIVICALICLPLFLEKTVYIDSLPHSTPFYLFIITLEYARDNVL